jgi:Ca-activated chloride channel family protein
VLLLPLGIAASAQQPVPTFRSSVAVVPINAVVQDRRSGRMITTLTASDFEVVDKGERRPILDFHAEQNSPLSLAVLIDTSGSMRISAKFALAHEVLGQLGLNLRDGRDEISVFTFDSSLHVEHPFAGPTSLAGALDGAEPFGTTSLYDAIAQTAPKVAERPSLHRAIVVVTDGVDTSSALTPAEVSALASSIDVPVYVVATVAPIDRVAYDARVGAAPPAGGADLRELAVWTGGELYWVTRPDEAATQARAVVAELRHEYLITVESATSAEWRPLEVRVRNRALAVRARSGYFGR